MRTLMIAIFLAAFTACTAPQSQMPAATSTAEAPQVGLPNPTSVHCKQNGNKLVAAADASQNGLCVFPDGSACDEWAYYRGECCPLAQKCPTPAIKIGGSGGSGPAGPVNTEEQASGGSMQPGTTEQIADWWGVIKSTEPGSQYDDYFERQDLEQPILFGIDSPDPAVQTQIKELRNSGTLVHLYGTLLSNVPDYNGSQIQAERIDVGE